MVGGTAMVAMAAPPLLAPLAVLVEVVVARRKVERYEGKKVGRLAYQSTFILISDGSVGGGVVVGGGGDIDGGGEADRGVFAWILLALLAEVAICLL